MQNINANKQSITININANKSNTRAHLLYIYILGTLIPHSWPSNCQIASTENTQYCLQDQVLSKTCSFCLLGYKRFQLLLCWSISTWFPIQMKFRRCRNVNDNPHFPAGAEIIVRTLQGKESTQKNVWDAKSQHSLTKLYLQVEYVE